MAQKHGKLVSRVKSSQLIGLTILLLSNATNSAFALPPRDVVINPKDPPQPAQSTPVISTVPRAAAPYLGVCSGCTQKHDQNRLIIMYRASKQREVENCLKTLKASQADPLEIRIHADRTELLKTGSAATPDDCAPDFSVVRLISTPPKNFSSAFNTLSTSSLFEYVGLNYAMKSERNIDGSGFGTDDKYSNVSCSNCAGIPYPNDPAVKYQWHLNAIRARQPWSNQIRGRGIKIGVIDTGIHARSNLDVPLGKTEIGYVATPEYAYAYFDGDGHGTAMATTISAVAHNCRQTAGVAPDATLVPIRIAVSAQDGINQGHAQDGPNVFDVMKGFALVPKDVRIAVLGSWMPPPCSLSNQKLFYPLHKIVKGLHDRNTMVIIPAGNECTTDNATRCDYLNVVAATNEKNQRALFAPGDGTPDNGYNPGPRGGHGSNNGPAIAFAAPGKNIVASGKVNDVWTLDGTAYSASVAAGVAALVWSANPKLRVTEVESVLRSKATKLSTPGFGAGLINASAAVQAVAPGKTRLLLPTQVTLSPKLFR